MGNFLSDLAQRGAGLAPVVAVRPVATPSFAADLHAAAAHRMHPEGAPVDETPPDGLIRPEPQPEQIPNPQRIPKPEPPAVDLRAEGTPPASLTAESKVEEEPAEPLALIRVVPRIQEAFRPEAAVSRQQTTSVPDALPSGRSSDSRARLLARLTPGKVADRSQTSPDAFGKIETVPGATPAIVHPPPAIRRGSKALLEKSGATPSVPQPIQVRIGTVEVRATTPPTAPPSAPSSATVASGFDDYAVIRSYRGWERY